MAGRAVVTVQRGIWVDSRHLAEAGLQDALEIVVQPGEITIRSASSSEWSGADAVADTQAAYPLLDESFREGWEAPGMEEYDRYEEYRNGE